MTATKPICEQLFIYFHFSPSHQRLAHMYCTDNDVERDFADAVCKWKQYVNGTGLRRPPQGGVVTCR